MNRRTTWFALVIVLIFLLIQIEDKNVTDGLFVGLSEDDSSVINNGIVQQKPSTETGIGVEVDMLGSISSEYTLDSSPAILLVIVKCKKVGTFPIKLTLRYESEDNSTLSFGFMKTCGSGTRDGFDIGLKDDTSEIVDDGVVMESFHGSNPDLLSSVEDVSDTFYLHTTTGSQLISSPEVSSDSEDICEPFSRDDLSHGGVITEASQPLVIAYRCKGPGIATVTVKISMGVFDPIKFVYKKHCGGGPKSGFHVMIGDGSSEDHYVVRHGMTQDLWSISQPKVQKPLVEVTSTFFVKMDEGMEKEYGIPVVSVQPPGISHPTLGGEVSEGGIANDVDQILVVQYHCTQSGEVILTVTLPIKHYDPIEFSWKKTCGVIKPLVHSNYITANHIMYLAIASLTLGMAYSFRKSLASLMSK